MRRWGAFFGPFVSSDVREVNGGVACAALSFIMCSSPRQCSRLSVLCPSSWGLCNPLTWALGFLGLVLCACVLSRGLDGKPGDTGWWRVIRQKVCPHAGKLRRYIRVGWGNCGGIWPKNGRKLTIYPRAFIRGVYPPAVLGSRCSVPRSFSVYRLLFPWVGASRPRDWVLPGGYTTKVLVVDVIRSGQSTSSDGGSAR